MAPSVQKRTKPRQIMLKDLNQYITCTLCRGYLVDATTLVDCLHVFCRACILRYFENFKLGCPTCNVAYKKRSNPCFRSDPMLQSLVYKVVPGLYSKEVQRREDFYRSTGTRASSSCSEDSVLGDMKEEHEDWIAGCGDQNVYLSPDDAISLSLEYYKAHLDTDKDSPSNKQSTNITDSTKRSGDDAKVKELKNSANSSAEKTTPNCDNNNSKTPACETIKLETVKVESDNVIVCENADDSLDAKKCDRRYLQCPAAVTMSHLQKFLRMKYALSAEHRVDIIYEGEVLPPNFSLMDVAYTFKWEKLKPMRFFYRIFTPSKIQPIKIISTPSLGGKHLQVVPAKNPPPPFPKPEIKDETAEALLKVEAEAQNNRNKERLMANLQLQSKTKIYDKPWPPPKPTSPERPDCIYAYEEPDKDEIRAFAEKRDREWALQKQLDEEKEKHRTSKKRKKSKHSKGNLLYKKRKLHAEITSSESSQKEESLKLKVKLTPHNGYKHKHHKSSQNQSAVPSPPKTPELSSKEKLLQMRQVRHKHIATEDKAKPNNVDDVKPSINDKETQSPTPKKPEVELPKTEPKPKKLPEVPETSNKATQSSTKLLDQQKPPPKEPLHTTKTLRSDFSNKTNATKELCLKKYPTVQIERNEQTERHAQKTFLKTFQSYTEKGDKVKSSNKTSQTTKSLEQKIANLHQQCTSIEQKSRQEKKIAFANESPQILNSQYSSGFTVSKVEIGAKRRAEPESREDDKRPSLEITLINPPPVEKPKVSCVTKRPPPPTIPLERIKKSVTRMSGGLSIIPKMPEKCDITGALDLSSKPSKSADGVAKPAPETHAKILNGLSLVSGRSTEALRTPERNIQLSNLQMLSKVATEHPSINKTANSGGVGGKRLPIPNLQTLRIPTPQNAGPKSLAKLPKLNEINKTQFRLPNPQLRNMRPNQNQSVRNIPNPSLLVRQQNQNRLNSLSCAPPPVNANGDKEQAAANKPPVVASNNSESTKSDGLGEKSSSALGNSSKVGS